MSPEQRADAAPPSATPAPPVRDTRSLTEDVFGLYSTRVVIIGLSMCSGMITARMLGPEKRGIFSLVYLFASTVVTICKLGMAQANVYSIRRDRVPPERVAANAIVLALTLGGAVATLALLLRRPLLATFLSGVPEWAMLISLPLVPVLLFESYFNAILQALGKFRLYNQRMLIGTVLLVFWLFVFLVGFKAGLTAAILIIVINPMLMNGWLLFTARQFFPLSLRFDPALFRREARFGIKSHVQVLAQHLHLRADVYLIAWLLKDPSQVAFYLMAVNLAEFLLDIPRNVGVALYPRLAALDDRAMHQLTAQACRRTLLITSTGALMMSLVGPPLIVLWYGSDYAPATKPLPYIAVGLVMMCVLVSLTQTFTSRNKQHINIVAGTIALVGNIGLNLLLIPSMKIVGAAIASTVSYTVAAGVLIAFLVSRSELTVGDLLVPRREDFRYFWTLILRAFERAKALALRHPARAEAGGRG